MNAMNTTLLGLLLAGAMGLAQTALADSPELYNAEGQVVHSGSGGCVHTGDWNHTMSTCPATAVVKHKHHGMMTLVLDATEFFGFNKTTLRPQAKTDLNAMVTAIKEASLLHGILIVGHADRIGPPSDNLALAMRRAQVVKHYLVDKGVPAKRIKTRSDGADKPLVSCPNIKQRRQLIRCLAPDRRVDIQATLADGVTIGDRSLAPAGVPTHGPGHYLD